MDDDEIDMLLSLAAEDTEEGDSFDAHREEEEEKEREHEEEPMVDLPDENKSELSEIELLKRQLAEMQQKLALAEKKVQGPSTLAAKKEPLVAQKSSDRPLAPPSSLSSKSSHPKLESTLKQDQAGSEPRTPATLSDAEKQKRKLVFNSSPQYATDPVTGFKITGRKVDIHVLENMTEGKKVLQIRDVPKKVPTETGANWVLFAVIVGRSEIKQSANNRPYIVWTLSDLSAKTVSLFVFSDAFQKYRKEFEGTIVAVLNPKLLPEREGSARNVSKNSRGELSIDKDQALVIGTCPDYGVCKGMRKDGVRCSKFVNLSHGAYCEYHVSHALAEQKKANIRMNLVSPFNSIGEKRKAPSYSSMSASKLQKYAPSPKLTEESLNKLPSNHIFKRSLEAIEAKTTQPPPTKSPLPTPPQALTPCLGRGLDKGVDVCFDPSELLRGPNPLKAHPGSLPSSSSSSSSKKSVSDRMLLDAVRRNGGIAKLDPNKPAQMVLPTEKKIIEPKKTKLSDEERERLMNAKSRFEDEWTEEAMRLVALKFQAFATEEEMIEKLKSVTEREATCYQCKTCDIIVPHKPPFCVERGHSLQQIKCTQRWFTCNSCQAHITTYKCKLPTHRCPRCNRITTYEQASMYRGSTEVENATSRKFLARGVEHGRFIGSTAYANNPLV